MNRSQLIATFLLTASSFASSFAAAADSSPTTKPTTQPQKENYSDKYGVLSDRNMFARERSRPRERTDYVRPPRVETPPPTPEQTLVLRGIVLEEGELRAYFEDTADGQAKRVAPGDAIASGHVMDIAIDAIQFERDGQLIWVQIGHNLTGAVVSHATPTTSPTTGPSTAPTTGPSAGGTTDPKLLSKEEEMKQRRKRK